MNESAYGRVLYTGVEKSKRLKRDNFDLLTVRKI